MTKAPKTKMATDSLCKAIIMQPMIKETQINENAKTSTLVGTA